MIDVNCSSEVAEALKAGKPVVALESTVFSPLGLPPPANKEAYNEATSAVRKQNTVPAVTAVVDGLGRVGLEENVLERLLKPNVGVKKVSLRDLPITATLKQSFCVTTVSASLALAHKAGIKVFATGGIGGVHRENPNDVSADLTALSQFPVATVCSGAKAFLDLPATLERLETLGVAVVGYGTDCFPAFWCRESNMQVAHRVGSAEDAASILRALIHGASPGSNSPGVLFAVPPPKEHALEWSDVSEAMSQALKEVRIKQIMGHDITPYVLRRVREITNGGTLPANIALVANNAAIAADIAAALAKS